MKRLRISKMENPTKDEAEASTSHKASTSSCERVKTLEEAKGIITTSIQVLNAIVLFPTAGDSGSDDTDPEYVVPDDPEDEFDPAGELEVEEELDVEEFEDIKLSQKQRGALPQWKKSEDLVEQLQPNENLQNMASLTLL
ncbi:hypothetical protein T09_7890 [Trichinella sp. T9]|nr:hypothetical protein T09_7890 [Trichinella sp. T9]